MLCYTLLDKSLVRPRVNFSRAKRCHGCLTGYKIFLLQLLFQFQISSGAGKKMFFFNCGIHAREWVTPATCMIIIKQVCPVSCDTYIGYRPHKWILLHARSDWLLDSVFIHNYSPPLRRTIAKLPWMRYLGIPWYLKNISAFLFL